MSSPPSLPPLSQISSLPDDQLQFLLDNLFEPSPAIHATLIPVLRSPSSFPSYPALIDACRTRLFALTSSSSSVTDRAALLCVLGSHPRLGEKKITSAHSKAEQANLQATTTTTSGNSKDAEVAAAEESEKLAALNREYEATFPGLRYVVFVNGRGRPEIMRNMRERIDRGDFEMEVEDGLQAMCDIAKDRASKMPVREVGGS